MPPGLSPSRRLATAARWPVGVSLTAWRYMWRTTPLHRTERDGTLRSDGPPPLPAGVSTSEVQGTEDGVGPLFHRVYEARIREARLTPEELVAALGADPDRAAPSEFARFIRTAGEDGPMRAGEEFLVRMAGPWDGPVRVAEVTDRSFRLMTLDGHLEAGQIDFSARREPDGMLVFRIESWARSADRFANLLYHRLRMAKEIQLHMWTSFLERLAELAGGRLTGGVRIDTRRVPEGRPARALDELRRRDVNYDPAADGPFTTERGWRVDDLCRALPGEDPGPPQPGGSWDVARRLMRGYEFADPSIVRAEFDPGEPLEHRTMRLELRFRGLRIHVGVRVAAVYEEERAVGSRTARVWGWGYETLVGHLEAGRMDWQVWKWLDTGEVQFRIHAYSRRAHERALLVRLGFRLFGRRERLVFLHSTQERMARLTEAALRDGGGGVSAASEALTARPARDTGREHEALGERAATRR